jgi:hypothetical protein
MRHVTNVTPTHRTWLEERVFGVNRNHFFFFETITVDVDTIEMTTAEDNRIQVTFRARFVWEQRQRDDFWGDSLRQNDNVQTITMYRDENSFEWYVTSSELIRNGTIGSNQINLR